ncbi:MAG: hypothetical protein R3E79_39040 [Caldilineaceae bacterium]
MRSLIGAAPVYGVAFSPDGRYLATAGADCIVGLHLQSNKRSPPAARRAGLCGRLHPDPNAVLVATAAGDGSVYLWDAVQGAQLAHWRHQAAVKGIAFSPDGQWLVTASADQTVGLWDLTHLQKRATIPASLREPRGGLYPGWTHLVTAGMRSARFARSGTTAN